MSIKLYLARHGASVAYENIDGDQDVDGSGGAAALVPRDHLGRVTEPVLAAVRRSHRERSAADRDVHLVDGMSAAARAIVTNRHAELDAAIDGDHGLPSVGRAGQNREGTAPARRERS